MGQKNLESTEKILAIIPARGGSKGIPNKNMREVNRTPLIGLTISKAVDSKKISEVFVSTDSSVIADYAESLGVRSHPLRPDLLSGDDSKTVDVVIHVIDMFLKERKKFDFIVLLEPTSPLRKKEDIDSCIAKLLSKSDDFDALVTIGLTRDNPTLLRTVLANGRIEPFLKTTFSENRRQELPEVFFPFGVAYIIKTEVLLETRSFYPERTLGFRIEDWQCFEVDNPIDLLIVEKMVESYGE